MCESALTDRRTSTCAKAQVDVPQLALRLVGWRFHGKTFDLLLSVCFKSCSNKWLEWHVSSIRQGSGIHGLWTEVKERVGYPEEGIGKLVKTSEEKDEEFPREKDEEFPREYCFCTT